LLESANLVNNHPSPMKGWGQVANEGVGTT
jgi:hypothetical protein